MIELIKKSIVILIGMAMILTLSQLSSCTEEDDSEYVSCDGGTCSSSEPYSNQYSNSCYATISACESATGHSCKNCN